MKIINKNPAKVVPNILESDIMNKLFVVNLHNTNLLAYVVYFDQAFNWVGKKYHSNLPFEQYSFRREPYAKKNLIDFLIGSWKFWSEHWPSRPIIIYVIEDVNDIQTVVEVVNKSGHAEFASSVKEELLMAWDKIRYYSRQG